MAQQLTGPQKAVLDLIEPILEEALESGCEYPPGTSVVPQLSGYTGLASVNGADLRPQVKAAFKSALMAYLIANPNGSLIDENWHVVDSLGEPAFQNNWTNYGSNFDTCAFYKDALGIVHLRGRLAPVSGTASSTIFTLPAGYIPPTSMVFIAAGLNSSTFRACRVDITDLGAVALVDPNPLDGYLSLNGISYRVT